jgi:hypothetical protein
VPLDGLTFQPMRLYASPMVRRDLPMFFVAILCAPVA